MNKMSLEIIYGLAGLVVGFILGKLTNKKIELDSDMCLEYLKKKGYWVNLNVNPKGEKR